MRLRFMKVCAVLGVVFMLLGSGLPGLTVFSAPDAFASRSGSLDEGMSKTISATSGLSHDRENSPAAVVSPENESTSGKWLQFLLPAVLSLLLLVLFFLVSLNLKTRIRKLEGKYKQWFREYRDDLDRIYSRINRLSQDLGHSPFSDKAIIKNSSDAYVSKEDFDKTIRGIDNLIDQLRRELLVFHNTPVHQDAQVFQSPAVSSVSNTQPRHDRSQHTTASTGIMLNNSEEDLCRIFNTYSTLAQEIINRISGYYMFSSMRVEQAGFMNVDIVVLADSENKDAYYLRTGRSASTDDHFFVILDPQRERYSDSELESLASVFQFNALSHVNRRIELKKVAVVKRLPQGYQLVRKGIIDIA